MFESIIAIGYIILVVPGRADPEAPTSVGMAEEGPDSSVGCGYPASKTRGKVHSLSNRMIQCGNMKGGPSTLPVYAVVCCGGGMGMNGLGACIPEKGYGCCIEAP
jgi:hypothetical protein